MPRSSPFGGLTPKSFLRQHWQKRPLLVRGALPEAGAIARRADLVRLAARHDVEARLVARTGARWTLSHGPLPAARFARAGRSNWTLLVSGLNLHRAAADALLRRFDFVPQARLDDVMVSYAVPGGGVGPHFDSYDVFLVQGMGRRVWRLCRPRRFELEPGAPLRLIRGFEPEEEILVEPGDLLYLPPGWGHDGVALEPSLTYSVGFRAPDRAELAAGFLDWLHARGFPSRRYSDPEILPSAHPGAIPAPLLVHTRAAVAGLRWSRRDVCDFLGEHLTAPKPHVVFTLPRRALAPTAFARQLARGTAVLDRRAQLLYRGSRFYVNGDRVHVPRAQAGPLAGLADARCADGAGLARAGLAPLLHEWYRAGMLHVTPRPAARRETRRGGKR